MSEKVIRIAVIGPESSGKSELCEKLADHFHTVWIKEYAREYLTNNPAPYSMADIELMYSVQFENENKAINKAEKFIFIDTEFIIAKVWCEHVFHKSSKWIDDMIVAAPYDLYLLTAPDLPWEYDPLRENPGKGVYFFDWYLQILNQKHLNYSIVKGLHEARLNCALQAIEQFTQNNK